MADYRAIAAVMQAIVNLLTKASRSEFPLAKFQLFQASDFQGSGVVPEGASVYLYRLGSNHNSRNLPSRVDSNGKGYRPSLPVDLFILVTPWAGTADTQYRLLGCVMRVLDDTPLLPAASLNELEQGSHIFAPEETVELIYDPLSLQDMSFLWDNLKQVKALPSVTYVARMVLLDS
jgi:hypothetical protein